MNLDERAIAFNDGHPTATMTTLRADGARHSVRVAVALVDGRLWSSGTQGRVRTGHLRRDPRCALMVFDAAFGYLSLDTRVTILDGPEAPQHNVELFSLMQGRLDPPPPDGTLTWMGQPKTIDEFVAIMAQEQRLIYEFEVLGAQGIY